MIMRMTFKALSALLDYPNEDLHAALPEIQSIVARSFKPGAALGRDLVALVDELAADDLLTIQERYTGLFDRGRSLSLHLFEHVHGDSRDRGPAMIDLLQLYRRHGFDAHPRELPDYLPLFIEFLSQIDLAEARGLLRDAAPIIVLLQDRLAKRKCAYAAVPAALLAIAEATDVVAPVQAPGADDDSFAALDRAWEEAAVTFGPENDPARAGGACDKAASWVARINAPAPR
jgi:nitrate reductase delta subunit